MRHQTGDETFAAIVERLDLSGAALDVVHQPCRARMVLAKQPDGSYAAVCPACRPREGASGPRPASGP